ncbi:MAG: DUF1326 domain-containing protein [Chloroflexi bacterium]|nr:DUF1326 domain-containing protein [Chloroflexota bacterium]
MAYRIAGRATELCSCNAPCPCAFGQAPTGGRCRGLMVFEIQEGNADAVSLAGTKAIVASEFPGIWSKGNWTAALILDSQASKQQRDALQGIFTGEMKGDAAQIAALIGDFKGVATAPISITFAAGKLSVKAGDLVEGAGETLKDLQGKAEIQVSNTNYPLPNVTAGKSSKVKANAQGMNFDLSGSGMWTGPFELKG